MSIPSIPAGSTGTIVPQAGGRSGESTAAAAPSSQPAPVVAASGSGGGQATSAAELNEALERVREALAPVARNLQFSVDDDTGKTVVRIIDSSTNEVIKQFPSEEMLAISRSIDKLQGLLLRQEA
ncbi:MAG: flagellar protein FlaG [Pseudazoarcus pumilus]|nr:flagellar protein FlaG [Pseudazoarcus pumilus]